MYRGNDPPTYEGEEELETNPVAPELIHMFREDWISKKLKERESEFTETLPATIFCGSFNVNAKMCSDDDQSKWADVCREESTGYGQPRQPRTAYVPQAYSFSFIKKASQGLRIEFSSHETILRGAN